MMLYYLYVFFSNGVLLGLCRLLKLYMFVSLASDLVALAKKDKPTRFRLTIYNLFSKRNWIAPVLFLSCTWITIFCNPSVVHLLGCDDIRILHNGTYCYYVIATDENYRDHKLPAQISISTKNDIAYYNIESMYTESGQYLYFDETDSIQFDDVIGKTDQHGRSWGLSITNQKAFHKRIKESTSIDVLDIVFFSISMLILTTSAVTFYIIKRQDKMNFIKKNYKLFASKRIAQKNTNRLLCICEKLIEEYEGSNPIKPSCKTDLMDRIREKVYASQDEVSKWEEHKTNYIQIAHTLLAAYSFDLLASGRYHFYAGMLNPLSCSDNLLKVHEACLNYAINIHEITEEQKKEEREYLYNCISQVG